MNLRCLLLAAAMTMLATAAAHATFVELTILGAGGADTVTIGPQGGTVPYTLFVETDPLGTPDNIGVAYATLTLDTDTGVLQEPSQKIDGLQVFFTSAGQPIGDDLVGVSFSNVSPSRAAILRPFTPFLGQGAPEPFAIGELLVAPAVLGTTFHASVFIEEGNPMSSAATIFETVGGIVTPDILIANTLTVQVVPEPSTWLLSIGLLAILALASTQRRAAGFIRHGSGPQRTIPTRASRRNHCLYGIQRTFLDFS